MSVAQFRAKTMTLYSCTKSCKNYDLDSVFMRNFGLKNDLFRINEQILWQNWFRVDTKLIEISCKKSHNFVQKHEAVAQEYLLFHGNPSRD